MTGATIKDLTDKQLEELRQAFNMFDRDGKMKFVANQSTRAQTTNTNNTTAIFRNRSTQAMAQ